MMHNRHSSLLAKLFSVIAMVFICNQADAQFALTGNEPFSLKWKRLDTPHYRIIYPEAADSLARVYGLELETARPLLKPSSGYMVGQVFRSKLPIVLHPYHATANAAVTWTPKRMDIYTVTDPYATNATPWARDLALHEGRHATQLQFSGDGFLFKTMNYIVGDLASGALCALPGSPILEGDAVVAETALSSSGRGRQYDFLSYIDPMLDSGDWRNYWQLVYGSLRKYTPDYYKAGYMVTAGTRVFFDDPLFMDEYLSSIKKLRISALTHQVRKASGMKFKTAFRTIEEGFHDIWNKEAEARAPFMAMNQVTGVPRFHTAYRNGTSLADGTMIATKGSLDRMTGLVRIASDGSEERIRNFASQISRLRFDPSSERIYWSEVRDDRRWTLVQTSDIYYAQVSDPSRIHRLTKGRRCFHPVPSPDGKLLSVSEYSNDGSFSICLLDAASGEQVDSYILPDGLQLLESAWIGSEIYCSALGDEGFGIWKVAGKDEGGRALLETLAEPAFASITDFAAWPGKEALTFVSDRNGVCEMYSLDVRSGEFRQVTSTRYGISQPFFNPAADTLYYSALATAEDPQKHKQGNMLYSTAVEKLPMRQARFSDIHSYPVADKLSEQERALAASRPVCPVPPADSLYLKTKRYSKVRFPHIHSWAPVYMNYDRITDLSVDELSDVADIGASIYFQNLFSTGYGMVGYNHHVDNYAEDGSWKDAAHLQYVYKGWYPEFEFNLDINDRDRMDIQRYLAEKDGNIRYYTGGKLQKGTASVQGVIKVMVPMDFSSGGIQKGFVPTLKWSITNDMYDDRVYNIRYEESKEEEGKGQYKLVKTLGEGGRSFMNVASASVRGYIMQRTAASKVYPDLGIGVEAGFRTRPGHSDAYKSSAYIYSYGYLPGFAPLHGFRLSASFEKTFGKAPYSMPELLLSNSPRGFGHSNLSSYLSRNYRSKAAFTVDYAIPFGSVDWSFLSPLTYIKNFTFTPFLDCMYNTYGSIEELQLNKEGYSSELLLSAGADLMASLGNFLWIPYDTKVGVRYARNSWDTLRLAGVEGLDRHYVSLLFEIDF